MFSYLRQRRVAPASGPTSSILPAQLVPKRNTSPRRSRWRAAEPDVDPRPTTPISPVAPVLPPIPRIASQYEPLRHEAPKWRSISGDLADDIIYGDESRSGSRRGSDARDSSPSKSKSSSPSRLVGKDKKRHEDRPRPATSHSSPFDHQVATVTSFETSGRHAHSNAAVPATLVSSHSGSLPETASGSRHLKSAPVQPLASYSHPEQHAPVKAQSRQAPLAPAERQRSLSSLPPMSNDAAVLRPAKSRLNLLNPLSLINRRRPPPFAVATDDAISSTYKIPALTFPDDYDPRIRGKGVHDFSAPRPRKPDPPRAAPPVLPDITTGFNRTAADVENHGVTSSPVQGESGRDSVDRPYVPQFREHFDKERLLAGSTEQPTADEFDPLSPEQHAPSVGAAKPTTGVHSSLPPFAWKLPSSHDLRATPRPDHIRGDSDSSGLSASSAPASPPSSHPVDNSALTTENKTPPPSNRSPKLAPRKVSDSSVSSSKPAGLPKHLHSNSSRFSFDLAGVSSSAQEKLLEEKHKRIMSEDPGKGLADRTTVVDDGVGTSEDDDDDMHLYDSNDEGLEEQIPGVNADFDEVNNQIVTDGSDPKSSELSPVLESPQKSPTVDGNVMAFNFHSLSPIKTTMISPISSDFSSAGPHPTPRDADGVAIGFALSSMSPIGRRIDGRSLTPSSIAPISSSQRSLEQGLGLVGINTGLDASEVVPTATEGLLAMNVDDDDFYFDDGLVEEVDMTDHRPFDESIFDRDKADFGEAAMQREALDSAFPVHDIDGSSQVSEVSSVTVSQNASRQSWMVRHKNESGKTNLPLLVIPSDAGSEGEEVLLPVTIYAHPTASSELTRDNLDAFHHALAKAANAQLKRPAFSAIDGSDPEAPRLENLNNDRRLDDDNSGTDGFATGYDDEDDDYINDESMIAAANAEALENDGEGFYGHEFGFYASGNVDGAEAMHGGFFGDDGLNRSRSGHAIFREPNLTPITELSEYSNRNSFMSLQLLGQQAASQQTPYQTSPGLAQIAGLIGHAPFEADDVSLSALLKLRRGAWGGSNGSLRSSGGGSAASHSSTSPSTNVLSLSTISNGASNTSTGPVAKGADMTIISHKPRDHPIRAPDGGRLESENDSAQSSPSITLYSSLPQNGAATTTHERKSSDTHQVNYIKDQDGGWTIQRKRTSADGKVEVLERTAVEGGRI